MTAPALPPVDPSGGDAFFGGRRVMAVLRNRTVADTVALTGVALDLGVSLIEVPLQTPDAIPSLEAALRTAAERGVGVGAGTITTVEQVDLCAGLGVAYTVAPGLDAAVVRRSVELGIPHLAGVATASEIQRAVGLGCTWVKVFPASALGTDWFGAMRGPFPGVRLFASGGLSARSAPGFLAAGAAGVALGSALEDPAEVDALARLMAE
ncbi:bifunctional 4-hydroxy-2-oxoglutarate aldolase/2-dehydro-3-deoxy-phosphogluconate aldolase [Rathayibacter sp. Leaf296]|uniref:bifunctional 4-hydroxy-2-oxoglutarate aldolase/2-dehydro-3-deoxy-phosphogluconate aldolase n=1 Tax=Rathayibacter sp. Leaf296 TaxID=1736327 RepID=UPI000703286B|nr:bifunctional 4-hydroxy-2-oxoglutarate aldolase/2-dehydro-3-deoxy-phosphogluconate aldolase [Rathayibacter sp. Leaf296]KQQ08261.1 2-dehydro-3-deoxyphosphogluconate aldolase [Rathayibacter sp. Leaf296]